MSRDRPGLRTETSTRLAEALEGSTAQVTRTALMLVAASLAVHLPFARFGFLNVDEATHVLGARTLMEGGRLYIDFADNKPPLVYFVYAAAEWLFGPGIGAVRLFFAAFLVPGTALAAAAFHGYGRRGLAAGLAFVLSSATLLAADAHVVHCEHVMLLPAAWALVLLRAKRFRAVPARVAMAGVLLGLAALGKQPALLFIAGFAAVIALDGRRSLSGRMMSIALLVSGACLPWMVFAAWMHSNGSLDESMFWIWRFNATHVDNPMPTSERVGRALLFGAGLLPAALPLLVAAWFEHREAPSRDGRLRWFFLAAALVPAFLGFRFFGHYFLPALFPLALLGGPFFSRPLTWDVRALAVGGLAVLCFVVVTGVGLYVHDPRDGVADVSRTHYARIGDAIRTRVRRRSATGDCSLFVWGYAPMIYVYAQAHPASRFVAPLDSVSGYLAGNDAVIEGRIDTTPRIRVEHWDALMADLRDRQPCYIVDTAPGDLNGWGHFPVDHFPRLASFISLNYRMETLVEGAAIYVRRGLGSRRPPAEGGERVLFPTRGLAF